MNSREDVRISVRSMDCVEVAVEARMVDVLVEILALLLLSH